MLQKKEPIIQLDRAKQILNRSGLVFSDEEVMKLVDSLDVLSDLLIDRLTETKPISTHNSKSG